MKLFQHFVFVLLFSFLMSCSDDNEDFSESSFSFFLGDYDILLDMYDNSIDLYSTIEPKESAFKLNGFDIPLTWEYDEDFKEWAVYLYNDALPSEIDYRPGKYYSFYIKINKNVFSDSIYLANPRVNWPEIKWDSDFEFSWELDKKPYQQNVDIWITDDFDYDQSKLWRLEGHLRDFTISKKYWQKADRATAAIDVDLEIYHYKKKGNFIALSQVWVYEYFYFK